MPYIRFPCHKIVNYVICSEDEDYSVRRTEIKTQLRKRGYTNDMVEKQLKKVDNLDRKNLLQYNTKKQNNRVLLVIIYSKSMKF
jgi:predicted GNAT family acetyltransferase